MAAMSDTMVLGKDDPAALRVWSAHLRRMAEAALRAKTAVPDLRLARHDPWAIRLAGVLAIAAAALFARGDGVASLENALLPGPETLVVLSGPTFEAWANPPAYTGKPPLYLTELLGRGPLLVPVGTGIAIRVYGEPEGVVLVEDVSGAATGLSLSATAIQDAALVVTKDGSVTLEGPDGQLGTWTFTTIADAPPTIRLTEPVSRAKD